MLLSQWNMWSRILEAVYVFGPGSYLLSPPSDIATLHQDKFLGSCINGWYFFCMVLTVQETLLLHNLFNLIYKKACEVALWQHLFNPVAYIIVTHLTLTQVTMLSDFNTHTKEWKRYAAVMINFAWPLFRPNTPITKQNPIACSLVLSNWGEIPTVSS